MWTLTTARLTDFGFRNVTLGVSAYLRLLLVAKAYGPDVLPSILASNIFRICQEDLTIATGVP